MKTNCRRLLAKDSKLSTSLKDNSDNPILPFDSAVHTTTSLASSNIIASIFPFNIVYIPSITLSSKCPISS